MAERRTRTSLYCGPSARVSRAELPTYDASGTWVAELKWDGVWCLANIEDGVAASLASRTDGPLSASLVGKRIASGGSGMLVGELVADQVDDTRSGTRRLHLFEPIVWNGFDLRDLPLEERREALVMIYATIESPVEEGAPLVHLVERRESGFLAWYDALMAGGSKVIGARAEGLVLKKKGTNARATRADGKVDFWLRVKPLNQVDFVVIGPDGAAEKGTPKIALGLYKPTKDGVRVVKCMSPTWPAGMDLRPGMVVEVEGAEVFPSGAVRHGHIKRVRTDKRPEDCTYAAAMEAR